MLACRVGSASYVDAAARSGRAGGTLAACRCILSALMSLALPRTPDPFLDPGGLSEKPWVLCAAGLSNNLILHQLYRIASAYLD